MDRGFRPAIAACSGILGCAIAAGAVWVDPPVVPASDSFTSYPSQVEEVKVEAEEPLPSLPAALFLDLSTEAVRDHLLVTGRAVRPDDSRVAEETDESTVQERPQHYHPATVFETIMGGVILVVVASIAWLPGLLRRRRRHRHNGRRSRGRHRVSRSSRQDTSRGDSTRVRRRRRGRMAADQ